MRQKIILFATFFITLFSFSQNNFQGKAIYESKTDIKSIQFDSPGMNEEMKAKILAKMAKAFEKTFVLSFNKFESTYIEEEKLEMNGTTISKTGSDEIIFKNLKDNLEIQQIESFSKNYLVLDQLKKWDWQLINETKKIGEYTCLKATVLIPVSDEQMNEYEIDIKNQSNNTTNFVTLEKPQPKIITVWYTTEISIANGPESYNGLPGLILEVNDGTTIILCSKIIINPSVKFTIDKPKKGKKINRNDFEKMEVEKYKKMEDENGIIQLNIKE